MLKDSVYVRSIFLILNPNRKSPYVLTVCSWLRILINVWRIFLICTSTGNLLWIHSSMLDHALGFSSSNSKTCSAITYIGFLKSFSPQKSFLKCLFFILHITTLLQTNFYVVPKFTEHLQHFSDINGFLKQIWPVRIFLNWCFHHKNSLI